MRTTDLEELLHAVESIRLEMHPDLNPDFLKAVVAAEEGNPDGDEEALRAIQAALGTVLAASRRL